LTVHTARNYRLFLLQLHYSTVEQCHTAVDAQNGKVNDITTVEPVDGGFDSEIQFNSMAGLSADTLFPGGSRERV